MSAPPTSAERDERLAANCKAIADSIDRLQRTNAELTKALDLAYLQMCQARTEVIRLRAAAKLPEKEPGALNVAIYEAKSALAKARGESA